MKWWTMIIMIGIILIGLGLGCKPVCTCGGCCGELVEVEVVRYGWDFNSGHMLLKNMETGELRWVKGMCGKVGTFFKCKWEKCDHGSVNECEG